MDRTVSPINQGHSNIPDCKRILTVSYKSDLPSRHADEVPVDWLPVSAVTKAGLEQLMQMIVLALVPNSPGPGDAIPLTQEQFNGLRWMLDAIRREQGNSAIQRGKLLLGLKSL